MKISRDTVAGIRRQLLRRRIERGDWLDFYTELQDGGTFLLVRVEMPPGLDQRAYQETCEDIRHIIGDKIAPVSEGYSWMGVVKVSNEVVESVMSELLHDRESGR